MTQRTREVREGQAKKSQAIDLSIYLLRSRQHLLETLINAYLYLEITKRILHRVVIYSINHNFLNSFNKDHYKYQFYLNIKQIFSLKFRKYTLINNTLYNIVT